MMTAPLRPAQCWQPHPDDEAEVRAAMEDAVAGRLLSAERSEEFLEWMEGKRERPAWLDEFA
jgi:hypothetical protein